MNTDYDVFYRKGIDLVINGDYANAISYLRMAANYNHEFAITWLCILYPLFGILDNIMVNKCRYCANNIIKPKILGLNNNINPKSELDMIFSLAWCYKYGIGVEKDDILADKCFLDIKQRNTYVYDLFMEFYVSV